MFQSEIKTLQRRINELTHWRLFLFGQMTAHSFEINLGQYQSRGGNALLFRRAGFTILLPDIS